jgi:hypothetical protein
MVRCNDSCKDEELEIQTLITDLENKQNIILREGPKFMFPSCDRDHC